VSVPVFFDVDANVGEWSVMALDLFPEATIHAFEINPVVAEQLAARVASEHKVHVHALGLADRDAIVDFIPILMKPVC
jgi:FkbM family methyltransferase